MREEELGPNAGLVCAVEYFLREGIEGFYDWLMESDEDGTFSYNFIDFPGLCVILKSFEKRKREKVVWSIKMMIY